MAKMTGEAKQTTEELIERQEPAENIPRFPSGVAALVKKSPVDGKPIPLDDKDPVVLVNLSMAVVSIEVPNLRLQPKGEGRGHAIQMERLEPGQPIKTNAHSARRALSAMHKPGMIPRIVVKPPDGDCAKLPEKVRSFSHYGKTWKTCPYVKCKTCGEDYKSPVNQREIHFSPFQAQHFVRSLMTEDAIQRFVEEYDPRTIVVAYAIATINHRKEQRRERMGVGTGAKRKAIY